MKQISLFALALSGAIVASAGAYAAEADNPSGTLTQTAATMGGTMALGVPDDQREVIQPPASIDPGMALDPPQTGARMPTIHTPGTPGGRLILPK
jgi:hypothetical protein